MAGFDPVSYMMGQKAAGGGGGGSSTLAGMTDVDISNPTDGQTLVYNATSGKWENGAGGGGMLVLHANETEQAAALDKTAKEILDAIDAGKSIVIDGVSYGGRHNYFLFVGYYISVDDEYYFYFVNFEAGREVTVMYSEFQTDTENGYPVFNPQQ